MVRDFTKSTEDRLLKQIEKVKKEKWSWFTDAIGDAGLYVGKWFGLLSISDDMKNIKSYHKNVLDMTNMTEKELKDIFDTVYKDDKLYSGYFNKLATRQDTYNKKMTALSNMISPNFDIRTASEIKNEMKEYNKQLKALDGKITKDFEKEVDFAAKESMRQSSIGLLKGLTKCAADILLMPVSLAKSIFTGNPFGVITPVIDLIDDVFSLGGNLIGLTSGFAMIGHDSYNKEYWLSSTSPYAGVSGLTETLEADIKANGKNPVTSFMLGLSKKMDFVNGVCSIADMGISIFKNPGKIFDKKFGFTFDVKGFKKTDIIFNNLFINNITSKKNWIKYQGIYYRLQKYYKYVDIKNAKKAFDYAINFINRETSAEGVAKSIIKNSPYYKIIEKIISVYNDIDSEASSALIDIMKNTVITGPIMF